MVPAWRTSILLALLLLIAAILVLPEVDLPDVTSDIASFGVTAVHLVSAPIFSAPEGATQAQTTTTRALILPVVSRPAAWIGLYSPFTVPELRC